jgi:hypothetical protein
MTLPTNDDFANRELSIEELEAIAAGWPDWAHSVVHWINKDPTGRRRVNFEAAGLSAVGLLAILIL